MSIEELESPLINVNSLRKMWDGRQRSARAIKSVAKIDASYRKASQRIKKKEFTKDEARAYYKRVHGNNADRLYQLCNQNGGTWVKFGQFLSARPDLMPREFIKALEPLQNDTQPTLFSDLTMTLEEELGENWEALFSSIDEEPIATASIGQVHRATLVDGREVAVKIQLPEIKKLFAQDVILFRTLCSLFGRNVPQIDVTSMVEYLLKTIEEELDFTNEANNIVEFTKLDHIQGIKVPVLVKELSTAMVITTEWIEGSRLVDYLSQSDREKQKKVLFLLQNSYVQQVMRHGVYQGDPHPGNFLVDDEGNLYILDYGYMGKLTSTETNNFLRLMMVITRNSNENILKVLEESGFEGLSKEMFQGDALDLMNSMSGINRKKKMKIAHMDEIMKDLMEQFREYQITVPDYFLSIGRVFITVGGLLRTYKVPFNVMGGDVSPIKKADPES